MENWEKVEWAKSLGYNAYDLNTCQGTNAAVDSVWEDIEWPQ